MSGGAWRRVFRPRALLAVCGALAVLFVAGSALLLRALARSGSARAGDVAAVLLVTGVVLALGVLFGRVRVVADGGGVLVRNPWRARRLAWEEVVDVRLGRHDSWAQLDLADGSTLPALALQAADGDRARRATAWLRAQVVAHEGREGPAG